jgi:hypothetical protein
MDNERFATRETAGNAPPLFAIVSRPGTLPSHLPRAEAEREYFSKQLEALEYLNKARLARAKNPQSSLSRESVSRIRVLGEAFRDKDFFYLALHQAYCLYSTAPNEISVAGEPGLDIVPCLDILKQLFVDDQNLTSNLLTWFLEFPAPWAKMQMKKDFIDMLPQIQKSLDLISQHWTSFEQKINLRCYPPLISELIGQFGIVSDTLRYVICTAFARRIYGITNYDGPLEKEYEALFQKDQQNHRQRLTNRGTHTQAAFAERVREENEELIGQYMKLWRQYAPMRLPSPMP